jgi:hypothetical protein
MAKAQRSERIPCIENTKLKRRRRERERRKGDKRREILAKPLKRRLAR